MPCQPHLNMLFSLLFKTINFHPSVIFSQMSERDRPTSNTTFEKSTSNMEKQSKIFCSQLKMLRERKAAKFCKSILTKNNMRVFCFMFWMNHMDLKSVLKTEIIYYYTLKVQKIYQCPNIIHDDRKAMHCSNSATSSR